MEADKRAEATEKAAGEEMRQEIVEMKRDNEMLHEQVLELNQRLIALQSPGLETLSQ